jgi:hypothetical protein
VGEFVPIWSSRVVPLSCCAVQRLGEGRKARRNVVDAIADVGMEVMGGTMMMRRERGSREARAYLHRLPVSTSGTPYYLL